jgi:hypothetical protein
MLRASIVGLLALCLASAANAQALAHPFRFFEGATEMISMVDLVTKDPYRARTTGQGKIQSDGSLVLIQQVADAGHRPYQRRWHMRQVGPGRFSGTMTEAKGPVTAEQIRGRYRFRFKMKNGISIEQWLTPLAGGTAARSRIIIRKLGIKVGTSTGIIRKLR